MTKNKTPKMDLNTTDHTRCGVTAMFYQKVLYCRGLIPGWSVIICMNYKFKGHVSKYEEEKTKRTMGR